MIEITNIEEKLQREYKIKSVDSDDCKANLTCFFIYNNGEKEWQLKLINMSGFISIEESKEITKILSKLNKETNK